MLWTTDLSDHGYSQGQFRLCSHKMQVYDHGTRVPALFRGPGIGEHDCLGPTRGRAADDSQLT